MVRIELYGVPRLRAGRQWVEVEAYTVADALRETQRICPNIEPEVLNGGKLNPIYVVALNGGTLTRDVNVSLKEGDVLVLLTSQAGG